MSQPTTDIPIYPRIADLYLALGLVRNLPYAGFDAFRQEPSAAISYAMPSYRQGFFSIALLQDEQAQTSVNDLEFNNFHASLLFINPEQVVSWTGPFQSGYILLIDADFLGSLFNRQDFPFLQPDFGGTIAVGDAAPLFAGLFEQLMGEYRHPAVDTPAVLRHYVLALLYKVRQHLRTHTAATGRLSQPNRATVITEQFRGLITQPGQARKPIAAYAAELAVSPTYLSEAVKHSTGRSARELLYEVQLREARTLLRQTELTIGQISWRLGFNSHAHFSHFYRLHTGQSPAEYRRS
jgi:AraC-like DNA-binding protein